MTPRERVIAALAFRQPDRVPLFDTYWAKFVKNWRREEGLAEDAEIAAHYGVDIAIAAADETPWPSRKQVLREDGSGRVERDGWGRVLRTMPGAFFSERIESGLPERVDPDRLVFDPADLESRYDGFAERTAELKQRFAVFAKTGGPFLRTCFIRGEEEFLMDVADDPGYAGALAGRVADHLIAVGLEELRHGELSDTGLWIYDDMASNAGPMISPKSWEAILLPRYVRMVQAFKRQGGARFVVLHCDGNAMPLLEMAVEAGIDAIHPVERKAGMDPHAIRERFGKRLAIVGGICNAQVLPRGGPKEIEAHVRDLLSVGREGGLIAGSHSIGPDVPVQAYEHFVRALRRLGDYPLQVERLPQRRIGGTTMQSDVRVLSAEPHFIEVECRTPLKFGAVVMEALAYCEVKATVETQGGAVADGWGGIFLADFWAFPSAVVLHEARDKAMREITSHFCEAVTRHEGYAHPVDLFHEMEDELRAITARASQRLNFAEPMPYLGALVCASPVDAAIHDAFGIANGICSYDGYGPEFVEYDLSRYLGDAYRGRYIADFIRKSYAPHLPVFHLVGGLDKLRRREKDDSDPQDGLPVSLDEWVEREGLICLKVKLRGNDLDWDVERTIEVAAIGREVQAREGKDELYLSADTNEQCDTPDYVIEMLERIRERDPRTFDQILYVEQPTERDLSARRFDMRPLAKIKPVLLDESLTGLADFQLAMELGWSGIALKSCKCQSAELVLASKAEAEGVPYAVQDLTNPALALIHSVGLAARLNPIKGVEANSRQFFPAASQRERRVHPDLFAVRDGMVSTASLQGHGLGYRVEEMVPR